MKNKEQKVQIKNFEMKFWANKENGWRAEGKRYTLQGRLRTPTSHFRRVDNLSWGFLYVSNPLQLVGFE